MAKISARFHLDTCYGVRSTAYVLESMNQVQMIGVIVGDQCHLPNLSLTTTRSVISMPQVASTALVSGDDKVRVTVQPFNTARIAGQFHIPSTAAAPPGAKPCMWRALLAHLPNPSMTGPICFSQLSQVRCLRRNTVAGQGREWRRRKSDWVPRKKQKKKEYSRGEHTKQSVRCRSSCTAQAEY